MSTISPDTTQRVVFQRLRAIAAAQDDLLFDADLVRAGVSERRRQYWVKRGILVRVVRGVYRMSGGPLTTQAALHSIEASSRTRQTT